MKKRFFFFCSTLFFVLFSALSSSPGGVIAKKELNEVKGVNIAKNMRKGDRVKKGNKAIFKEELSIGVFEGDENKIFHKPMDVIVDGKGDIYVLDTKNCRIQKFDKNGNYLLTIGRKGEGPGEMLKVWDVELDSKGNVILFDWMINRVSRFDSQGKFIDAFKVNVQARWGVLDSEDNIYLYSMYNGKLVHKYSPTGEFLFSFLDAIKSKQKRTDNHINSLGGIGITRDDKIYLVLIYPYTIYVCSREGQVLKKTITETDYAVPPHITSVQSVITNFFITGLDISPDGYIFCRNISFKVPDKLNNNWIKTTFDSLYQEYSYVDIFDPGGNLLIHQKVKGFSWGGYFDKGGSYYGIEEGENCFKAVKYRVQF